MGYREYGMWEVLEVLRRRSRGESKAQIARGTGRSRFTVRRYIELALEIGWEPGSAVEPDDKLAIEVLQRLRPGPRASPADQPTTEQRLLPHIDTIRSWLAPEGSERGLRLSRVRSLLKQRHGIEVSYSGLRRFAQSYCQFGRPALTVRMADHQPAEVAECDFGRMGYVPDLASNKRRLVHALVVTLPYSRHQYVHLTQRQTVRDLIDGLEAAWAFFGGVPRRLIIDNMKAAVTRADRYEPSFQRSFGEYAHYRGFVIDAAVVRHPTGKPHVERNVQYVRESFFRGGDWHDVAHAQREAARWCREEAGKRIHGTTRQMPLVVFEQQERPHLMAFYGERFDPPHWAVCKVHPDHTISFRLSFYSIPTRYIGKEVDVRGDQQLVRAFFKGELIKTHPVVAPGKKSLDFADYPPDKAPYAMRDIDRLVCEAGAVGAHVGQFVSKLLATHCPWSKLRQAQKVLRLARKYGAATVDDACHCALSFDLINVRRLDAIVLQAIERRAPIVSNQPSITDRDTQLGLRFLRAPGSFASSPASEGN